MYDIDNYIKLQMSSIKEYLKWWREHGRFLKPNLPSKPYNTYSGKGWISWAHWLGK